MIFPWVLTCMSASLFIVYLLIEIRPIMAYLQSSGKFSVILKKDIEKEFDYEKLWNKPFEMKKYFFRLNEPDARQGSKRVEKRKFMLNIRRLANKAVPGKSDNLI